MSSDCSKLYGLETGMTLEHSGLIQPPGREARVSEKIEEIHALAPSLLVPYHSLLFEVAEKD